MPTFTSEVDKIAKYSLVKCIKMSNIGNYKRKYDINVLSSDLSFTYIIQEYCYNFYKGL